MATAAAAIPFKADGDDEGGEEGRGMAMVSPMNKPTVLIVEDNPGLRRMLRDVLEVNGYIVHVAPDAFVALPLAQKVRPDLILTDIGLPGMDGIRFARRIREDWSLSHVPILTMTAQETPDVIARVREAGLHGPLTKPVNLFKLTSQIGMLASNTFAVPL
jgi:CheY-like chemotaxis protein